MESLTATSKYRFKILPERTVESDAFEDKTHEKLAAALFTLVTSESPSISIGLEGSWGSGKSTVISILSKKIKDANLKIPVIQFDAWAHEGDPLRRIFLETIIASVKPYVSDKETLQLKRLDRIVGNRKKSARIKTFQGTTMLGKAVATAAFFIPIGTACMVYLSKHEYVSDRNILILTILGWLTISGPVIILALKFLFHVIQRGIFKVFGKVVLGKKARKIFHKRNWRFLQNDSVQKVSQEVSESDERSSVEFEVYFEQILSIVLSNPELKKMVLVVDNLDRIDKEDFIKVWSTLQTFLQVRGDAVRRKDLFDKIWIIVPYDKNGLEKQWNERSKSRVQQEISKSFFDKCFQLRLDVPKPIFSGWEKFTKELAKDSLINWSDEEIELVTKIIRTTRNSIGDMPTPREIKNVINQIGFLASLWGDQVHISSIIYYACWRELDFWDTQKIRASLVERRLVNPKHQLALSEGYFKDLAGLVFGVSPAKGEQLLLQPEISDALNNSNQERLLELSNIHGSTFHGILNYHFEHTEISLEYALAAAKPLELFAAQKQFTLNIFIKNVSSLILDRVTLTPLSSENRESYLALLRICGQEEKFLVEMYEHLIRTLRFNLDPQQGGNLTFMADCLQENLQLLQAKSKVPKSQRIQELNLAGLLLWTRHITPEEIVFPKLIQPSNTLFTELAAAIKQGQPFPPVLDVIFYVQKSGIAADWSPILKACQSYIVWQNSSNPAQQNQVFQVINQLCIRPEGPSEDAIAIAKNPAYYNLLTQRKAADLVHGAIFYAFVFKSKIQTTQISDPAGNFPLSSQGLSDIKGIWSSQDDTETTKLLLEIKRYQLWSLPWDIASETACKKAGVIIEAVLNELETAEIFRIDNAFDRYQSYLSVTTQNLREKVASLLIEFGDLENQALIETRTCSAFPGVFYYVAHQTNNPTLLAKIARDLSNITQAEWLKTFEEESYLRAIPTLVKKKKPDFCLENNYLDAITKYMQGVFKAPKWGKWTESNWTGIIDAMGSSFQKHYASSMTNILRDNAFRVPAAFLDINKNYFVKEELFKEVKTIQEAIEDFIKKEDFEHIKWMIFLLSPDANNAFKPQEHFPDVIRKPLQSLLTKVQGNEENVELVSQLAVLCKVTLDSPKA